MATITFNLPDDLVEQLKARGLFSQEALEKIISQALRAELGMDNEDRPQFDPRFTGAASPKLAGTVKFNGDIVAPIDVKWDAEQ